MISKLDLDLRVHLIAHRKALKDNATAGISTDVKRIEVVLECQGHVSDLAAVGFVPRTVIEHPTEGYKIVTGTIPVDRLEDLAAIDHVIAVEGPQRMHPHLNYSVPEIHADVLRNGTPARKGAGVVIGIIDTGVDWRHRAFVGFDDRTSRILAIWDQVLTKQSGDQAGPGGIGVEYSQDQISSALQGTGKVRALDKEGHGTHVAAIAAGDGSAATCCHGSFTYIGVAPSADLIVVRLDFSPGELELGENVRLADALNYIFGHPKAAGKPVVVNISLGNNRGAHDGTSTTERAIDAIVAGGSGRAVVVAAGNHASLSPSDPETLCHVKASVPGNGQTEIEFQIREGYERSAYLDLWYDRAGTLNLEVIAAGGASSGTVNHGTAHQSFTANPAASADHLVTVDIGGHINGPYNRDNNFRVRINKPAKGNIPKGGWKLKLTNPNAGAVNLHCWLERGENQPIFLAPVNPPDGKVRASSDSTLSIPSTAAGAITVANHQSKTDWCDCWPSQDIVPSSGRGPVARNAAANSKPDIAAPGLEITSAEADAANLIGNCCACCPDACCCLYQDMTGTSMSAPHVTGTIALMLEAKVTLTKADILNHLQHSARPAPAGGTKETWGAGKLDALAAVNEVLGVAAAAGGGAGPPGPPGPAFHNLILDGELGISRPWRHSSWEHGMHSKSSADALLPLPPWYQIVKTRLEALPDGLHLEASISRHFSEVRRLINNNRRVATMWHRTNGPRMLRRLFQCALETNAPFVIATDRHREYFDRWFDLLAKYGSRRLKASVERHRVTILDLLRLPSAGQLVTAEVAHS